jgi:hypothetical protein
VKNAIGIFGLVLLLAGCKMQNYYDNDEAIKSKDASVFAGSVSKNIGNTYTHYARSFNGMKTIKTLEIDGRLGLNVKIKVSSGRFKLVLVRDNELINICEGETDKNIEVEGVEKGEYKLKMVGDKAEFNLELEYL